MNLYVFIVLVFTTNLILSTQNDFFYGIHFEKLSLRNMTDQEHNIKLGKVVFDDNNQEKKSCDYLGQTCARSLIVFLSQLFVILLIIFGCFCRIQLSKTCDESTIWVGILCSAVVYILPSPRL